MKKTLKTVGIKVWNWVKKHPIDTVFLITLIIFVFYIKSNIIIVN